MDHSSNGSLHNQPQEHGAEQTAPSFGGWGAADLAAVIEAGNSKVATLTIEESESTDVFRLYDADGFDTYLNKPDEMIYIIKDPLDKLGKEVEGELFVCDKGQTVEVTVYVLTGEFESRRMVNRRETILEHSVVFFLAGNAEGMLIIEHIIREKFGREVISVGDIARYVHEGNQQLAAALNPKRTITPYYTGSVGILNQVFRSATVTPQSKILTALYCMFPQVRRFIQKNFKFIGKGTFKESDSLTAKDDLSFCTVSCVILCCMGAYPHSKRLNAQLERRYRALCADINIVAVDPGLFTEYFNRLGVGPTDLPGDVIDAIANTIALNQQGKCDIKVTIETMLSINDAVENYKLTPLARGIFAQMRLVFTNFRLTTLHFGFRILETNALDMSRVSNQVVQHFENLTAVKEQIGKSPFAGVIGTTPEIQQVAKNAAPCFIGVLYHMANLKNDEDIESFKDFNQAGIREHIQDEKDIQVCKCVATALASVDVIAVSSMINVLAFHQAEALIARLSEDEKEDIFNQLKASKSTSAWFEAEASRRARVVYNKYMTQATAYYENQIRDKVNQMSAVILTCNTDAERTAVRNEIEGWRRQALTELQKIITIYHATGPLASLDESETHRRVATDLAKVHALVCAGRQLTEVELTAAAEEALRPLGPPPASAQAAAAPNQQPNNNEQDAEGQ